MSQCDRKSADPSARRRRFWLATLVVTWGIQAIVTQTLLLREALVLMLGSEFAWGMVLFAWLLGVALGAVAGGWCGGRTKRAYLGLVVVLIMLSVAACLELPLFRAARGLLGVQPGELLPLGKTALVAVLFVSPVSALVGAAFPLAGCVRDHSGGVNLVAILRIDPIYALESAGSLIGGAVFTFWAVEHLHPIQTALACGGLTLAVSGAFTMSEKGRFLSLGCLAASCGALCLAVFAGDSLHRRLVALRWADLAPGYVLQAEAESKYQNLAIGSRAGQFSLYLDGKVAADFPDPYTFAPLAQLWMCQHPAPKNVLLLGGGAEGLLAEILKHPVEHVDYVETDARKIDLLAPFLDVGNKRALEDPRVTTSHMDARHFVKTRTRSYDLVIARLPEPMSAQAARFYTDEFYGELRRAMTDRAVLCTTAAATPGSLTPAFAEYLASIRATLLEHFSSVIVGWGNPAMILVATAPGLTTTDPHELMRRYIQRGVQSDVFQPAWFDGATDWLSDEKVHQRATEIAAVTAPDVSTDLKPRVYIRRLALWESTTEGRDARVFESLQSIGLHDIVCGLMAAAVLVALWSYGRSRLGGFHTPGSRAGNDVRWSVHAAIVISIGSTGLVTMSLSLVWLFAFQNLYGYVYQRIGWIIALFMGGLVAGCAVAGRFLNTSARMKSAPDATDPSNSVADRKNCCGVDCGTEFLSLIWLFGVDVLLALLCLSVPLLLPALGRLQAGAAAMGLVEVSISMMVIATGVLGGAAFAAASRLSMAIRTRPSAVAGTIVGADHAGACLGALLCGILLVPVFGTIAAAYVLTFTKISSAAVLLLAWRVLRRA